ncbi:tetratricopeptide repeat-containing sulfotransferase family protein [Arenimonas sp.]|uniref:tetratricopeptide repeat-containing sulfotransferase family protein n=1 Tax=Arenimonas sp. TaxID=1872635 RepID=UPI0039E36C9F
MTSVPNDPSRGQANPTSIAWQQAERAYNAGDFDAALRAGERVLDKEPLHSPAHLMLANLRSHRDEYRLSTRHALQAAEKMGVQSLQHIAAVTLRLITVGEYERAFAVIRKIDPRAVKAPPFLVEFAQQLSLIEQHEDALRYLDAAISYGIQADSVGYIRGNYLKFLGRLDEAAAEYERALAINPNFAYAHWALAYLGAGGDPAPRIDRIRRTLAATADDHPDRAYLQYALFRELDGIDATREAWQALAAGAASKRRRVEYDAAAETALLDRLAAACGADFLRASVIDPSAKIPIFVLGMPRTGTTLLERILGGNRDVTLCGELNDFRMQFKWASDHHCLGFIDETGIARLADVDFDELGQRYLQHVGWRTPSTRHFSDKNPGNFILAGLILRALPQAKIVHLRRGAMDSCFSNLKELFAANAHPYSYDFQDLAAHYRNYSRLMAHWHSIAPGRILDVHYEAMVSDPDTEARRVMDYCGLDYRPEQIRVEDSALPVSTASSAQVRQPIHRRNIGGWKRYADALAPLERLLEGADSSEFTSARR